jgi:hypothetical protein
MPEKIMPINHDTTWEEVGSYDPVTNKAPEPGGGSGRCVRDAFKNGTAKKVQLENTFKLYKFNHGDQLTHDNSNEVSPWWSPYLAYEWDAGWEERKKLAAHLKVNIRELGRVTSAVKENWSSLSHVLVVQLKQGAYGYFGGFAQMCRIDDGEKSIRDPNTEAKGNTKNLPGGGTQFYIPNLTTGNVTLVSVELLA